MNWKQRILRELLQLTERIALIQKKMDSDNSELLRTQAEGMMLYQQCLIERLDNELEDRVECLK